MNYTLLVFCCSAALLLAGAQVAVRFTAARTGSAVVPKEFLAQPVASERTCSFGCSLMTGCFGFYWLLGACRLFDLPGFLNASSWIGSVAHCNVFVLDVKKLSVSNCSQSSIYLHNIQPCSRVIDGNTNQDFYQNSCIHTNTNPNEWWEASLTAQSLVSFVTIYNRQDCCAERLNNFDLLVDGSVCNQVRLSAPFSVANFTCNAFGSRVRILSRMTPPQPLHFCEFLAFGF